MEGTQKITFESQSFGRRLKSMLKVDFRRMFTMPLFYIMAGVCLAIPILILVMTTMLDGSVRVDPNTGVETVVEGFDNVWQIIGTVSGEGSSVSMDMTGMCNINLLYFFAAVLVCLFVTEDFKSGYVKNLFAVRSRKTDYVISKTLLCFIGGACMLLAFVIGAMLGGAISGLPFDVGTEYRWDCHVPFGKGVPDGGVCSGLSAYECCGKTEDMDVDGGVFLCEHAVLYDDSHADAAGFRDWKCDWLSGRWHPVQCRLRCGQQSGIEQNEPCVRDFFDICEKMKGEKSWEKQ